MQTAILSGKKQKQLVPGVLIISVARAVMANATNVVSAAGADALRCRGHVHLR